MDRPEDNSRELSSAFGDGLDAFAPAIERVLARDPVTTSAAVLDKVREGTAQLWDAGPGSVLVTQVLGELGGEVVAIWLASGELEPLLARHDDIVAWARSRGASKMRITGRAGWVRVLEDRGYKEVARVIERELGD